MSLAAPVPTSPSPAVGSWRDPVALLLASTGEGIYGVDLHVHRSERVALVNAQLGHRSRSRC